MSDLNVRAEALKAHNVTERDADYACHGTLAPVVGIRVTGNLNPSGQPPIPRVTDWVRVWGENISQT
jgi:hypothetical protein